MHHDPASTPPDVLANSREKLLESHIIHDFDLKRVLDNLGGCYGQIMNIIYRKMLTLLKGKRIIDCGCGFGQFSRVAIDAGFEVTAIDIDDASLVIAREVSQIPCRKESAYATSLAGGSCDTAVCCDSIQHLDIGHLVPELDRLGVQRVIIYDSNVENGWLNRYRAARGHEESNDRTADEIVRQFCDLGYVLNAFRYENYISLPLSGGFQRPSVLFANRFPKAIVNTDCILEPFARAIGIDRRLAFRFLIVLDRKVR